MLALETVVCLLIALLLIESGKVRLPDRPNQNFGTTARKDRCHFVPRLAHNAHFRR